MCLTNVDGVVLAGSLYDGDAILGRMRGLGLRIPLVGGVGIVGLDRSSDLQSCIIISMMYLPDQAGAKNQAFVAAYRTATGDRLPDHRGASAYDIMYLLAQAFAHGALTREAVRSHLAEVGTVRPAFEGVTGTIAFDQNGDVPGKPVVVGTARGGSLVSFR